MELKDLLYIIIAILIAAAIFQIFAWLLPIIVILVIAFVIYIFISDKY
ncbi:MAG: hypothetical protein K8V75_00380 [Methanobrevibacter woesei]|nr:hypothetical protein [Methanobrevibacter woesei]MCC9260815.1 hypothetical protein [Methanobrevibacter woesei]MCI7290570.1 hypothetical protein [Methanobrevibacter woesei]